MKRLFCTSVPHCHCKSWTQERKSQAFFFFFFLTVCTFWIPWLPFLYGQPPCLHSWGQGVWKNPFSGPLPCKWQPPRSLGWVPKRALRVGHRAHVSSLWRVQNFPLPSTATTRSLILFLKGVLFLICLRWP